MTHSGSELNILSGSVIDAGLAQPYQTQGTINEIGSGKVLRPASAIGFTDMAGSLVAVVPAGTDVYVTLHEDDGNLSGSVLDTAQATVESLITGDVETLTLTETGSQTGEFRNASGLPTAVVPAIPDDGILQQDASEDLRATYTDSEDAGDSISRNLLILPTVVWDGDGDGDGGGADDDWSTAENWSTNAVPTAFDNVLFDATTPKDCVITQTVDVSNFTMAATASSNTRRGTAWEFGNSSGDT